MLGAVTDPVKTHIDGLGVLLFDHVIDDATCHTVICLEGGCWLWVAKLLQSSADGACSLHIEEQCTKLSFGSTGHNLPHDLAQDIQGPIVWWHGISGSGCIRWLGAEEVIATSEKVIMWRRKLF